MDRNVRLRELLVGVEGLALLRHLYDGADDDADRRLSEVRRLLDDEAFGAGERTSEADARTGYASWSEHYDEPGNPIIAIEQPAVWSLLDSVPVGRGLDAACGTGRHCRRLADLGHEVVGIDLTPEMLARAGDYVPDATFVQADLEALPLADRCFDFAVCGLALAHVANLARAVSELGRVLKDGGRLVVSVLHPFQAHLGWQAPFEDASGGRAFVREHPHTHGDYLAAVRSAGLEMRDCIEPALRLEDVRAKRRAFRHIPDATAAAYVGLPGVLIWDAVKPVRPARPSSI